METLLYVLLAIAVSLIVIAVVAWVLWRRATREERGIIKRVTRLRLGSKLQLARRLVDDGRVPPVARAALPLLVLYLALPIDIIPDFIPVLGLLDDVFLLVVGLHLLLRFVPRDVLDGHLLQLEHDDLDARAIEASRS